MDNQYNFLDELKDRWFWIYLISLLSFTTIWYFGTPYPSVNIFAAFGVAVSQLVYNLKVKFVDKISFFPKFIRWAYFSILLLFASTYSAAIVKDVTISVILLLTSFGAIIISAFVISLSNLLKSENVYWLLIGYSTFAFTSIVLFGYIFTITSAFDNSKILDFNNHKLEGAWNYVAFSSSIFYTNTFGETPSGWSKLVAHIELAFSFILHIIVLGAIVSSLTNKKID